MCGKVVEINGRKVSVDMTLSAKGQISAKAKAYLYSCRPRNCLCRKFNDE